MTYQCIHHYHQLPHQGQTSALWQFQNSLLRVNHCHASETNIILNYSAARMLFSYRLSIWTYQVYIHCIPCWNILGCQTSINSLSLYELLTYIARISIQFYFFENAFPVAYHPRLFLQVYYHWGGWDRNSTNISQICADFSARIFFYHNGLSWHHQDIAWSNLIPNTKCMCWVWNLLFTAIFVFIFSRLRGLVGKMLVFLPYQFQITSSHNTEP